MSHAELEHAISRAAGEELRRARDAKGWSRDRLVKLLPSGIGARTLLSYEHGTRHLTLLRFVEICRALEVSPAHVLCLALQRARIHLDTLALWVDLRQVVTDRTVEFGAMVKWAHNKLIECPGGVVEVTPSGVAELATMIGSSNAALAAYFTRFTPDVDQLPESEDDLSLAAG